MIIDLPERFFLNMSSTNKYAVVKRGVLHIYGKVSFRKLMYTITYTLKGNKRCFYCGKTVGYKHMTMDHMYPKDLGGPTITNNLVPCCDNCNSKKSSMSAQNYMVYRSMNKDDADSYRTLILNAQELSKNSSIFELPLEWITTLPTNSLTMRVDKDIVKTRSYKKQVKCLKKYGNFSKPIVVDKNNFVIEGKEIVFCATMNQIEELKAIVLENVEVHL